MRCLPSNQIFHVELCPPTCRAWRTAVALSLSLQSGKQRMINCCSWQAPAGTKSGVRAGQQALALLPQQQQPPALLLLCWRAGAEVLAPLLLTTSACLAASATCLETTLGTSEVGVESKGEANVVSTYPSYYLQLGSVRECSRRAKHSSTSLLICRM